MCFQRKQHSDGTVELFTFAIIADGYNQHVGIDCAETFGTVIKPTPICVVLSSVVYLARHSKFILHGILDKCVYGRETTRFIDHLH